MEETVGSGGVGVDFDDQSRREQGRDGGVVGVGEEEGWAAGGGGGGLTFAGFMSWSMVHGGRLQLVKDLVYMCLSEFGMRPAKAMQEREVIQEIFRRYSMVQKGENMVGYDGSCFFDHLVGWLVDWGLFVDFLVG